MSLHEVNQAVEKHTRPKRLGRGVGTGQGKTAGKGHKGQRARAGWKSLPIFQGGGSPLVRRVPKRGFTNSFALIVASINVGDLDAQFEAGEAITPDLLRERGIVKGVYDLLKILGDGDVTKKLTVSAHRFSATATVKIEKAGGTVETLKLKTTVAEKKAAAKAAKKAAKP
jgi:large subunit ribosomal protein L15